MKILTLILALILDVIPSGKTFLEPLNPRDSVLVADQFKYGFSLEGQERGDALGLADMSKICNDTLVLVKDWQIDTLKNGAVNGYVVVAPFEEGVYELPSLYVLRAYEDGTADTLCFEGSKLEVKAIPVDTATFEIKPLKGQINYPLTFKEVLPYLLGGLALAALIALCVIFLPRLFRRKNVESKPKDPAHIVALRELEKYRSDKYWAPSHQKAFYSGITDILKIYMDERYRIDAPEMTTEELFSELKGQEGITPEMYDALKELFQRADFVKFAKFVASDEENASALPLCVRFVTATYQAQLEKEDGKDVL